MLYSFKDDQSDYQGCDDILYGHMSSFIVVSSRLHLLASYSVHAFLVKPNGSEIGRGHPHALRP